MQMLLTVVAQLLLFHRGNRIVLCTCLSITLSEYLQHVFGSRQIVNLRSYTGRYINVQKKKKRYAGLKNLTGQVSHHNELFNIKQYNQNDLWLFLIFKWLTLFRYSSYCCQALYVILFHTCWQFYVEGDLFVLFKQRGISLCIPHSKMRLWLLNC